MQKTSINPAILQPFLESAANATDKGQAQWFTPLDWAKTLALPLAGHRPVIVDLTAGSGQFLAGTATKGTWSRLACDIDTQALAKADCPARDLINADLTRLFPLLVTVNWKADCFVLNPPWDLHWYRESLDGLLNSDCLAVQEAFLEHDRRLRVETIDSTVATLMMALDRLSDRHGDGVLIANEATLQRLVFNGPHSALARHIWAHLVVEGNLCAGSATKSRHSDQFQTGIIYFSRCHGAGVSAEAQRTVSTLAEATAFLRSVYHRRPRIRDGAETKDYLVTEDTAKLWAAVGHEWRRLQTIAAGQTPGYNLWLDATGHIRTDLSLYDELSGRVDKAEAAKLYALNGCQPLQFLHKMESRRALARAAGVALDLHRVAPTPSPWTVDPKLQRAVTAAFAEYNRHRAPLYQLPEIQRLGFLDEHETILCRKSMDGFQAGVRYALRSATVQVNRTGRRMNLTGLYDDVQWDGQELAFFLSDDTGIERMFMEARLREPGIVVSAIKPGARELLRRLKVSQLEPCAIDFTLQELVAHFHVPEVPDVSQVFPQEYRQNLAWLRELEALVGAFTLKQFQREDLARGALHPGFILAWATGLGKTFAMFVWPLLKVGFLRKLSLDPRANRLLPHKPVLLVVPGDGHDQTCDEAQQHFHTMPVRLDSQAAFHRLAEFLPGCRQASLPAGYYLTSYTQLSQNGVQSFPEWCDYPPAMLARLFLTENDAAEFHADRGSRYGNLYERLGLNAGATRSQLHRAYKDACRKHLLETDRLPYDEAYGVLNQLIPKADGPNSWEALDTEQKDYCRDALCRSRYSHYQRGIGETWTFPGTEHTIKCVYDPTLADLCAECFEAIVVDEGTKIQGEETLISLGVRQINARYRMVMSATPIKNRFPQIFRLAHYACGSPLQPTPRFPFGDGDRQEFAKEFQVGEVNKTAEAQKRGGRRKLTAQVCNVHLAWKLFAPIVLRRRMIDCGEEVQPKIRQVIRVPMGLHQAAAYKFHLDAAYKDCNGKPAFGPKLQALRQVAANPASADLIRPEGDTTKGEPRSPYSYIPKYASVLTVIQGALERREQILIGSAFEASLDGLSERLSEAGIPHLVLDGRSSQARRGKLARQFKQGSPRSMLEGLTKGHSEYPVVLAGVESMAELHSFPYVNNVALMSYSWAYDKFEQFINRVHRLVSPWPVNLWSVICDGSIDRKLEGNIHEKRDAVELVLDGHLLGEDTEEVNLAELLHIAHTEFEHNGSCLDERDLERDWPKLRASLALAYRNWSVLAKSDFFGTANLLPVATPRIPKIPMPPVIEPSPARPPVDVSDLPLWRKRVIRRK